MLMTCSCIVHDLLLLVHDLFTTLSLNLSITCSGLNDDLFIAGSWLVDLFITFSWHVHGLLLTCSWLFYGLLLTCSWLFHCLLLTCSLLVYDFLRPKHDLFMVHDLLTSCSLLVQLVHQSFETFHNLFMP